MRKRSCKIYTDTAMLEAETITGSTNLTNKIPPVTITEDDCCIKLRENITYHSIKLQPIKFSDLNLDELEFAQHKLNEMNDALEQQLNQPFFVKHSGWFTTILSTVGTALTLYVLYKLLRWFGFFSMICHFLGRTDRDPDNNKHQPCVQVFTHCFNKPPKSQNTELTVSYQGQEEPSSPRYTTRRTTRSTASSSGNQCSMKVTSE